VGKKLPLSIMSPHKTVSHIVALDWTFYLHRLCTESVSYHKAFVIQIDLVIIEGQFFVKIGGYENSQ
jgi:hypothetical protein